MCAPVSTWRARRIILFTLKTWRSAFRLFPKPLGLVGETLLKGLNS